LDDLTTGSLGGPLEGAASVYGALLRVDDAMQPDAIEDGLQGSTAAATYEVDNAVASLDAFMEEAAANISAYQGLAGETGVFDILADLAQGEDVGRQAGDLLLRLFEDVVGVAVTAIFNLFSIGISGGLLLAILYDVDRIARTAITGEEVDLVDV